jgi:hypothetical protein
MELGRRAGMPAWMLIIFENGLGVPADLPTVRIVEELEAAGVTFVEEGGLQPKLRAREKTQGGGSISWSRGPGRFPRQRFTRTEDRARQSGTIREWIDAA